MESTWNSAWVSITLMMMMMMDKIVTGLNILIFFFFFLIYLATLGLRCSIWDLHPVMWDLLLRVMAPLIVVLRLWSTWAQ